MTPYLKYKYHILLTFIFLLGLPTLQAQPGVAKRYNNKRKILGDTTTVYYNSISNPTLLLKIDTSLYEFEDIDPTWNKGDWYSNLGGLLGSPTFDLVYQPQLKGGLRVGLNQFDRYQLTKKDIKYYQVKDYRPYTDLYYSQINQQNNLIKADFGYRFNKNIYLGVQYDLINQSGFYAHQKIRNQNVGFTLRAINDNKKYHGYFSFLTNAIKYEDNGGVAIDTIASLVNDALANVPIQSGTAASIYNLTTINYSQFLYNNQLDSLGAITKATNEWSHQISYQFNRYKFFDKRPDYSLYGQAYTNQRGARLFIRHQLLKNKISFRQAIGNGGLSKAPLWVKAYISHSWHILHLEPIDFSVHNISAGLITQNNPQLKLKYRLEGKITLANSRLDFNINGRLGYDMGKFGYLQGQLLFQRYQASLIDRLLYVSWDKIWDNNFSFRQIQELNFGGSYELKSIGFKAEILNHTLTNWVYYDSVQVRQAPSSINILQVKVQQKFKVWKLHLDNQIIWQPTLAGKAYFRVPELLFKHNLYIESYVFKKAMLAKVGVLFYYNSSYYANGFNPLTGSFFNQNRFNVAMIPRLDAYVSFRIWQFRFFIRGENLSYFIQDINYHTAYKRPVHNMVVRLGISWRLFD